MKILVILHVHYEEQVPYFIGKLSRLAGMDWDLVVSGTGLSARAKSEFTAFKQDTRFIEVENVGYDIWPFIKVIREEDINAYDVIFKLHTKGSRKKRVHLNSWNYRGFDWRNELVDSILGSAEKAAETVSAFESPAVGMVCSKKLYMTLDFPEDKELLDAELKRLGLDTAERRFCVGTMFAVRPQCLEPLLKADLSAETFAGEVRTDASATPAHVYERILGILPAICGYEVKTAEDRAFDRKMRIRAFFGRRMH